MVIKVGHDGLYEFAKTTKKDKEDYEREIEKMQAQIEILRGIWIGEDAKIFCDKAHDYIENMKKITHSMGAIYTFSEKANKSFAEADLEFAKKLNEEANNYEE